MELMIHTPPDTKKGKARLAFPPWQGIATAPRDGSEFFGYGWSEYRQKGWTSIASWAEAAGCFIDETGDTADRLTHWMPMPPPPTDK